MQPPHLAHWPSHLPQSITVPATALPDNLETSARRYPDKAALVFFGRAMPYRELAHTAERLAAYLHSVGVRQGDRVILLMQNLPQLVAAHFAILRANAVVVPVKNTYEQAPDLALAPLAGKPLLDYTLDSVAADPGYACVLVATDDPAVVAHCQRRGDVQVHLRARGLSDPQVPLAQVVANAVGHLEGQGVLPDIVVVLSAHTPLRRAEHIQEAIDTLLVYPVDQVVSTWENLDLQYRHGGNGMQAVNAGSIHQARFEREALYSCNGAIRAMWRETVSPEGFNDGRVGHIVMTRTESLIAKKPEERRWLEAVLAEQTQTTPTEER